MKDLRAYLRSLDVETLADLLHEQAERDPELHSRLWLRAGSDGSDLAEVSSLLDRAVSERKAGAGSLSGGFSEAPKITAVLDTLQHLLDSGTRADVVSLARRTVERLAEALGNFGDTAGPVRGELRRAVGLYARACAAHPPDPEQLADWILGIEFDARTELGIELADFAEALGKAGFARIKSTVDDILRETEFDGSAGMPVETRRRRRIAERLSEQLAEISGDVDTLQEILSGRLPRVDVNLKIVRVLRAAGRTSEAIAHAARALARNTGPARGPGVGVLAEAFDGADQGPGPTADQGAGQHDEVVALRREEFKRSPDRCTYFGLREAMTEAGFWDTHREWALDVLRDHARHAGTAADELVAVLREEGKAEEAWQAALRHECSLSLKLELAEAREVTHPGDVIEVYQAQIEDLIGYKDADHYRHAAKRLRKLRTLYRKAGRSAEFSEYLAGLVRTHRRKARLLAEIRNARIALPAPRTRATR